MFSGRPRAVFTVLLVLVVLAAVTPFLPEYVCILLIQALIFGILAMGLDLLLGYTGLPSLGQAAYFGVGAYAVAILTTRYEFGFFSDCCPCYFTLGSGCRHIRPDRYSCEGRLLSHAYSRPGHGSLGTGLAVDLSHRRGQRHHRYSPAGAGI